MLEIWADIYSLRTEGKILDEALWSSASASISHKDSPAFEAGLRFLHTV